MPHKARPRSTPSSAFAFSNYRKPLRIDIRHPTKNKRIDAAIYHTSQACMCYVQNELREQMACIPSIPSSASPTIPSCQKFRPLCTTYRYVPFADFVCIHTFASALYIDLVIYCTDEAPTEPEAVTNKLRLPSAFQVPLAQPIPSLSICYG